MPEGTPPPRQLVPRRPGIPEQTRSLVAVLVIVLGFSVLGLVWLTKDTGTAVTLSALLSTLFGKVVEHYFPGRSRRGGP
ncbi:MAG: hypothetical protein QOE90_3319 [Thermoplasmata archaeon]|jgi:hypothetical protein|nr:hypothetical protein [Thermoplasmata archaeon]